MAHSVFDKIKSIPKSFDARVMRSKIDNMLNRYLPRSPSEAEIQQMVMDRVNTLATSLLADFQIDEASKAEREKEECLAQARAMLQIMPRPDFLNQKSQAKKEGIMDAAGASFTSNFSNYAADMLAAGIQLNKNGGGGFPGYQYLASLMLRSEYQRISHKYAEQCTRKGIVLSRSDGKDDKEGRVQFVENELKRLDWQRKAYDAIVCDRAFGGAHTLLAISEKGSDKEPYLDEMAEGIPKAIIGKGTYHIKELRNIEVTWVYPAVETNYNEPAEAQFYEPSQWTINGRTFSKKVLLTLIGIPVPDIFKPGFFFRGMAANYLCAPAVDRYLNNAQSASDLLKSFSMVVFTGDMGKNLKDIAYKNFMTRMAAFVQYRDNKNIYALNTDEKLEILATPLTGVTDFVSQSLEQVAVCADLTVMAFTSQQPSGLNASGEGETRTMYETIKSYQETRMRPWITDIIESIELLQFGDSIIDFEFENLHEPNRKEEADIQLINAQIDTAYGDHGVISDEDILNRLKNDDNSIYANSSLPEVAPGLPDNVNDEIEGIDREDLSLKKELELPNGE